MTKADQVIAMAKELLPPEAPDYYGVSHDSMVGNVELVISRECGSACRVYVGSDPGGMILTHGYPGPHYGYFDKPHSFQHLAYCGAQPTVHKPGMLDWAYDQLVKLTILGRLAAI